MNERKRANMRGSALPVSIVSLAILLSTAGCGGGGGEGAPNRVEPANPTIEGPITGGGGDDCCTILGGAVDLRTQGYTPGRPFFADVIFDPAEVGYEQKEYFMSGTASSYTSARELSVDGLWNVTESAQADYRTRIVVYRPIDPKEFNGTVVMEWFNVSGGIDAGPDWLQTQTELRRSGYAYVGVSAQSVGVEGGGGAFDISLKVVDPVRYGSLSHPGDDFAYDIFSQAAQAVRRPRGMDPLGGLRVKRIIAVGQSQSAYTLVTYFNAVQPKFEIFDAFLIHSRGADARALALTNEIYPPTPTLLREDLRTPVITLQGETDLFRLGSIRVRQPDTDYLFLWEVAGSAHSDIYTTLKSPRDRGGDASTADVIEEARVRPPFIECEFPANDGPMHWVAKAAIHALDQAVRNKRAIPTAPRLGTILRSSEFILDDFGNVRGGVRTPHVEAPVAILSGEGQVGSAFCDLFGRTTLFGPEQLRELYPTRESYVSAIEASTDDAVAQGFLLEADGELIKQRATEVNIGGS
ncbi:MAG: alpha/beta hydrolase domain-containing protein [Candidatus Binatia bacterium]|nr:alpha/beta hydrolase domain-containing protein [Candidatus Binatia bacterium]MDG2008952.1 alpha/beta hydrolase domain-containing protein [Candidatus Binatia bacterium]